MGDDGAGVLLEMVPSARPPHAAMPRGHGRRATATNVKRRRTRSCSRRSTRALGATVTGVRDGGDGSYVNHHDVATPGPGSRARAQPRRRDMARHACRQSRCAPARSLDWTLTGISGRRDGCSAPLPPVMLWPEWSTHGS